MKDKKSLWQAGKKTVSAIVADKEKTLWQTIKYALFSLSAGVIQEGSFMLLYNVLFQHPIQQDAQPEMTMDWCLSYIVSLTLSVAWNFTLNRKYAFKDVSNVRVAMLKVAGFYAVFAPLSLWVGYEAIKMSWNGNLVQILTMFANFILEFLFFKFVVFREPKEKEQK